MKQSTDTVTLAAALLLAVTMVSAQAAAGPRYTYIEGGYQYTELDDPTGFGADLDGSGFFVAGSFAVTEIFHVFGGYSDTDLKVDLGIGTAEIDYQTLNLGVGLNWALNDRIDLVGRVAWVDVEAKFEDVKEDDSGFGLSLGLRSMLTDRFEINTALNYVNLGSDADELAVALGTVFGVTDMLALTLTGQIGQDSSTFNAGVRLYFGGR